MAFKYRLVVQEDKPAQIAPGTFWLIASQGIFTVYYQNGNFQPIASGKGNLSISDGEYFRTVIESESDPVSPDEGDLWLATSQKAYYAYIGGWVPFGGG